MIAETIHQEIEDAGRRHYAAASAGDSGTLDQLLAEDLVYTHSDGLTEDKTAYLARVAAGAYRTMNVENSVEYLISLSDDLAVARCNQVANGTFDAGTKMENVEACSLDVWARRDGRWQLVGHHTTLVMIAGNWRKAFEAGH
jgi:ketosteroid isomerase-like protein